MLYLILPFLGYLYTLCFAPHNYFALGMLAFPAFLIILDILKTPLKTFFGGFLFAFGHHISGLYWISNSLLVEADKFAWLVPFAVSVIPAYLSIYIGLAASITYKLKYNGLAKVLFFSSIWVLFEILRSQLFTGFPWNLTGYTILKNINLSQIAAFLGVYGLSLFVLIVFLSPYLVINAFVESIKDKSPYRLSLSLIYLMPIAFIISWLSYWGGQRIAENKDRFENISIRIVQPNIPQNEKFDNAKIGDHLFKYYTLTVDENEDKAFVPDLIVWPEAATPYVLTKNPEFLEDLKDIIPYGAYLALGTIRTEGEEKNQKVYNSIQFVDSEGVLSETKYDKHHLVPFGEYIPFRKYFPNIEKITHGMGDFSMGQGIETLKVGQIPPFSPSICYEIIFPKKVADFSGEEKPRFILNVTNDGWFGLTSGPYQHLEQARMRAIEEGISVIRSANTGVSAIIDPLGRIMASLDLNKYGVVDGNLPASLNKRTFYSIFGNKIVILIAAFFMSLALFLKYYAKLKRCHQAN
ncbi:MAG: apolipoprotein N-acyltransferase [Rickettsiales bacterium]|nr:apolipoprotein N-acyltransferase [Rickettsiales bacterium]